MAGWFSKDEKKQSQFFRKEEGGDVFYPWTYPGEGFYIDPRQKKHIQIVLFITSSFIILSLAIPSIVYRSGMFEFDESICIALNGLIFCFLLYFFYICFYLKNFEDSIAVTKKVPRIIFLLPFMMSIQILIVLSSLYVDPLSYSLKGTLILVFIIYSIFIIWAIKKKGFFIIKKKI